MLDIEVNSIPTVEDAIKAPSSRYSSIPILEDSYNNITTLGLYRRDRSIFQELSGSKVYQITSKSEYRPDLISESVYGDISYWWVLLEANNIGSIEELVIGKTLEVPPLDQVLMKIGIQGSQKTFA